MVLCINVSKRSLTNQTKQTKATDSARTDNHLLRTLSPTNLLPTVGYVRFLYASSSSVKAPLSSQVANLVLIPAFNVFSSVLSMVFFLRASCCFPAEKKTRSIMPAAQLLDKLQDHFFARQVVCSVSQASSMTSLSSASRATLTKRHEKILIFVVFFPRL